MANANPEGMTEQEIRDAGLTIDLPWESGPGRAGPIRYADDAGEEDWVPEPGWEDRLVIAPTYDESGETPDETPPGETPEGEVKPEEPSA